jgi:hypothetical protein
MGIFMICAIQHLFLIDCIRFWFELISQKINEMKNLKMAHFTFIISYHLPFLMGICSNYHEHEIYEKKMV